MKRIKYIYSIRVNRGTEDDPLWVVDSANVSLPYSEINEAIAKAEAYNGEYTIEDDGVAEEYVPTTEERLVALETAMLEMLGVSVDG